MGIVEEHKQTRVRRARGYHLYMANGDRYIDMYLDDGRAMLGHDALDATSTLKSVFSRGLLSIEASSMYIRRIDRHVQEVFGLVDYRFSSLDEVTRLDIPRWYPYMTDDGSFGCPDLTKGPVYVHVLGLPQEMPVLVLFPEDSFEGQSKIFGTDSKEIFPSEFTIALMIKGLIAMRNTPDYRYSAKLAAVIDADSWWKRKGPYVAFDPDFGCCLELQFAVKAHKNKILLELGSNIILPQGLSPKEEKKLCQFFRSMKDRVQFF